MLQLLPLSNSGLELSEGSQHFLQHGEQQQIVSAHFLQHKEAPVPIFNDYPQKRVCLKIYLNNLLLLILQEKRTCIFNDKKWFSRIALLSI